MRSTPRPFRRARTAWALSFLVCPCRATTSTSSESCARRNESASVSSGEESKMTKSARARSSLISGADFLRAEDHARDAGGGAYREET